MATRMILFIGLIIYMIAIGFLIPAISNSIIDKNNKVDYKNDSYTLPKSDGQHFNLITSIIGLPLWFNIIFLLIPFIAIIIIGITLFFPTGNAGG